MHQFMIYIHQLIKCDDDLYQALIKCREVSSLLTILYLNYYTSLYLILRIVYIVHLFLGCCSRNVTIVNESQRTHRLSEYAEVGVLFAS